MFSFWDQAEGAAAAQGSSIPESTEVQESKANHNTRW